MVEEIVKTLTYQLKAIPVSDSSAATKSGNNVSGDV